MARVALNAIELTIAGKPERSRTTIATVGAYVVVVATAVPARGVTLTSCYLADMQSDIAAAHLSSAPSNDARIRQRVLARQQPGQTHARACLLDHTAELQTTIGEATGATVAIDVGPDALARAADAWTRTTP